MARNRIVVDLSTGLQSTVPYTPEEEAAADAAAEAEAKALDAQKAIASGSAKAERQRESTKEEINELVDAGDLAGALKKALELI